jgi:drug/metabolite transporter (DMT)-like permease
VAVYFLPVVATLLGVAFRDESVGAAASVGLALIVAGASFTSRREALPSANGERTDGR